MIGTVYPTNQATLNQPMPKGGFNPSFKMFEESLDAVKGGSDILRYAADLTQLRRKGKSWRGCCPVHGGDNPDAFAVYPDAGRFYCYRCNVGGDIIDLAQAVEGHAEKWTAMISLAQRYGIELPQRSSRWYDHQTEKNNLLNRTCKDYTKRRVRRYYRVLAPYVLQDAADEKDRQDRSEDLWDSLWAVMYSAKLRELQGHGNE